MSFEVGPKTINNVKRHKERASYDYESVHKALDEGFFCHVSFCIDEDNEEGGQESTPVIIPMIYGRKENTLYLHGYVSGRLVKHLAQGRKVCIAVSEINGLVLALSPFHHSVNYKSCVVFGRGGLVDDDDERLEALQIMTDHMVKGRWDQCRDSKKIELQTTKVVKIDIESASVKQSYKDEPVEDKEDYKDQALCDSVWTGIVPLETKFKPAIPSSINKQPVPENIRQLYEKN
ncbi:hypothetical protein BJ944DRAFT_259484 [Cunninghamella echinulata]|nr:hypothetical protein BJ944DRAFT_259484 [Cunninghamella echinulata]